MSRRQPPQPQLRCMSQKQIAINNFSVSIVFAVNLKYENFKLTAKIMGGIPGEVATAQSAVLAY